MIGTPGPNTLSGQNVLDKRQLSTLVDMGTREAVHQEVIHILGLISPTFDNGPIRRVFTFTVDLYEGQLQEYRACNTGYHNLRHITDTYLAMARLLHGAQLSGENFDDREIILGLTGALMHDTGMIQEARDTEGTGAKYTQDHVRLSMDFVAKHAETLDLSEQEITDLRDMILCTDLLADIQAIDFSGPKTELLGKILGTADLLAQMADRTYLEKLLFLYQEFREAEIGHFKNEIDFLHQTLGFFETSMQRFRETLDDTSRYLVPHFKARWSIDENLYFISLENQRAFLKKILQQKEPAIYRDLKRSTLTRKAGPNHL